MLHTLKLTTYDIKYEKINCKRFIEDRRKLKKVNVIINHLPFILL